MNLLFEKRLILILLFLFLGLEMVSYFEELALILGFFLALSFTIFLFFILKLKPKEKNSYPIFILPAILIAESAIVLTTIPNNSFRQVFIILSCLLLYLVSFSLEAIRAKIESYSVIIFNILTIANLIAAFFGYVIFYNTYVYYNLPEWIAMLGVGLFTSFFYLFTLWQNDLLKERGFMFLGILGIISIDFFWVFSLFPFVPLQGGFILFLVYYVYSDITIMICKGILSSKKVIRHISVPIFALLFLLISINW